MTDDELIRLATIRMELNGSLRAGWIHGLPAGHRQLLSTAIDELSRLLAEKETEE